MSTKMINFSKPSIPGFYVLFAFEEAEKLFTQKHANHDGDTVFKEEYWDDILRTIELSARFPAYDYSIKNNSSLQEDEGFRGFFKVETKT